MIRHTHLEHRFVHYIPERIAPGVLYVSVEYATAVHSCCCGCGEEIVTPLTPTDWQMVFDGETISLWPSIGNWNAACQSHYVISRGKVVESAGLTTSQVAFGRRRDRAAKAKFFGGSDDFGQKADPFAPRPAKNSSSFWSRLRRWRRK